MELDLIHSEPENLLLATPFSGNSGRSFSGTLQRDEFFEKMYSQCVTEGEEEYVLENNDFNSEISQILETFDNPHMRVKMLHLVGYSGSGKTTYVQYVIWKIMKTQKIHFCYLDFEGQQTADNPIRNDIISRIMSINDVKNLLKFYDILLHTHTIETNSIFDLIPELELFEESLHFEIKYSKWTEYRIEKIIDQMESIVDGEKFIYFLLVLDFLLLIYERVSGNADKVIMVIDNIDSIDPIAEEIRLVPELNKFVHTIYTFVNENIHKKTDIFGNNVGEIFTNSKFLYILTTRLVTSQRHTFRSDELSDVWNTVNFPKQYYSHRSIVKTKIDYFGKLATLYAEKEKITKMNRVYDLMNIVYTNQLYKRLFNGNFKYCVHTICYFENRKSVSNKFKQCFSSESINEIPADGITGIVINSTFNYFKDNGIYGEKLGLVKCEKDGLVTCSRLVLTIIREKNNHCSIFDIYRMLSPAFAISDISHCVYSLSEAKRQEWRRLIMFEGNAYPDNEYELIEQGKMFENSVVDNNVYTNLRLCDAGEAYLDQVIPHFEFMLTRHYSTDPKEITILKNPLFALWGAENEKVFYDDMKRKVLAVFNDVSDCCFNCQEFAGKIISSGIVAEECFLDSEYNYRSTSRTATFRQTYEARLIFSHIGYIERFRRYLLSLNGSYTFKRKTNRLLVSTIMKYLALYQNINPSFRNETQDSAAEKLIELANAVTNTKDNDGYYYADFETKIDLSVS